MLARKQLRRTAVGSLLDEAAPYGPSCDSVGPIYKDCDGKGASILDSPSIGIRDKLTDKGEASFGLPAIAVYAEDPRAEFDGDFTAKTSVDLNLLIEIYVTGESDWEAEDCLDDLQERVMYRLMRRDPVCYLEQEYPPLMTYQPSGIRSDTDRDTSGDLRIYTRALEISVSMCDVFDPPDCYDCDPLCLNIVGHQPK